MNNDYGLYNRSYNENPFKPASPNGADDSADVAMSGVDMAGIQAMMSPNNMSSLQDASQSSIKPHNQSSQQVADYSSNGNGIRRVSMVEFGGQPSINNLQFNFNPSLSGSLDHDMAGNVTGLSNQYQKTVTSAPGLSVDTQFANVMDFNPMASANTNFTSPLDMDLTSPYLNNNSSMDPTFDMGLLGDNNINVMSDMFSAQQFNSPIITSPMNATFAQSVYGQSQNPSNGMLDTSQMLQSQNNNPSNISMTSTNNTGSSFSTPRPSQQQSRSQPQKPSMGPPSTSTSSSKSQNQAHPPATIGDMTLPWSVPIEGWPSTMEGSKPHMMSSKYQNVYAPSGFDLMKTLFRVVSRSTPEINLGAVDLSCAFVVCDAKSHDNPIVYCSESFERLTGYTKHEITGQNCRFLQSPDGKVEAGVKRKYCDDNSILYLKNSISRQTEAQISLINYRKGGQPFMNLLTMIPIRDDDGEVFQFVGFQVDLVENPHAVNSKNPDGTFSVNYQRHESLPPYLLPTPEQSLMDHGQSVTRDEVSTVLHTIASSGDNELSRRMLDKVLLENSDDVIHVLSLKGLFLYLSPSCRRVLEYKPSELVGSALSSVCHPSDIVPVTRELKEVQNSNSASVVFRIRRKESGYVWFESHGSLHTEQGKGRKCIILVGRERPVYTLAKQIIMSSGGIGDHEIWSKMSTTGMFLYVSNHVKGLLDRQPDELIGTNIQSIMRSETKKEFDRVLQITLTGKSTHVRHELMNRRGMVHQAHTWLYPGDACEGQKPTFLIAQTRLLKYTSRGAHRHSQKQQGMESGMNTTMSLPLSNTASLASPGGATPRSSDFSDRYSTTGGIIVTKAGTNAMPIGRQDESLASDENAFEELKTTRSSSWQYELRQLEKRNRLLAEEVQQLMVSKKKRKRRRGAGLLQKDCANCHTTNTPEWRRGPSGNRDLCNSCGLRWAKQVKDVQPFALFL
jgi:PAS domain S-box-containing protein